MLAGTRCALTARGSPALRGGIPLHGAAGHLHQLVPGSERCQPNAGLATAPIRLSVTASADLPRVIGGLHKQHRLPLASVLLALPSQDAAPVWAPGS